MLSLEKVVEVISAHFVAVDDVAASVSDVVIEVILADELMVHHEALAVLKCKV